MEYDVIHAVVERYVERIMEECKVKHSGENAYAYATGVLMAKLTSVLVEVEWKVALLGKDAFGDQLKMLLIEDPVICTRCGSQKHVNDGYCTECWEEMGETPTTEGTK